MGIFTARSELRKVLFLALSVTVLFVCVRNISETAERICAKFTWKTCLVPLRTQTAFLVPFGGLVRFMFGKIFSSSFSLFYIFMPQS